MPHLVTEKVNDWIYIFTVEGSATSCQELPATLASFFRDSGKLWKPLGSNCL
jgi:hypothetical protein